MTLCNFPWNHLFVDSMGYFYNCCIGIGAAEVSKYETGEIITANDPDAILHHWKSVYMKSIREQMQAGGKPSACINCWRVEESGGTSYRSFANEGYRVDPEVLGDLYPKPDFQFIDLRFGNMCNLACRMCVPYSSRKLIAEHAEFYGEEMMKQYLKLEWFESESFWADLFKYSENAIRIHLAGGEPLLIKQCWAFLRKLVESGKSKELMLSYNTNLTILPKEAKEIWPHFKEVHLIVSIDGVGKVNEFIRHPLDWNKFETNVREIVTNKSSYNVSHFEFHATAQVYNIKRLVELCEYVASYENIMRVPRIDIVFGPDLYDPQILPAEYRDEAARDLDNYVRELKSGKNNLNDSELIALVKNLNSISSYLRSGDKSHRFHDFKRMNDIFDRHRKQQTFDFIPELEAAYL